MSIKTAATRIGVSLDEYRSHLEAGEKWCTSCRAWHSRSAFQRDASRSDGLHAQCRASRHKARRTAEERFLRKTRATASGCIEWTGSRYPTGYGSFYFDGRVHPAHRVAWLLAGRKIADGLYVLHRCDNRPCVNVEHLFLGTHQDNMDDMAAKGRRAALHGESNPRARLSPEDVDQIRLRAAAGQSQRSIGRLYGISKTQVAAIAHGRSWTADRRELPATTSRAESAQGG